MNEYLILFLGTIGMVLLVCAIILYTVIYQRKVLAKAEEIERLRNSMYKQQLNTAYAVLDGQDKERKRIAREVHDNLGSELSALKLFADVAPQKSGSELLELMTQISRTTSKAAELSRDIAHSLSGNRFGREDFLEALYEQCDTLNKYGNLSFSIEELKHLELPDGQWLEVLRILQELVSNTLKYAKAHHVSVTVQLTNEGQQIKYTDDGIGFVSQNQSEGFGLHSIKQRALLIHASFTLESTPGEGMSVVLAFAQRNNQ